MTDWDAYLDAKAPGAAPTAPGTVPSAPTAGANSGVDWGAYLDSKAPPSEPWSGSVLPFSRDTSGKVSFDPNAGLLGPIYRAVNLPGDVALGKIDPMSDEGKRAALDFATTFSPASAALSAGERLIPGVMRSKTVVPPTVPATAELKAAASTGYDAARATGAEYPGAAVAEAARGAQGDLNQEGFLDVLAPKTHTILRGLTDAPEGSVVTISSLDAARKALNKIPPSQDGMADYAAARRVIDRIDGIISDAGRGGPDMAPPAGPGVPVPAAAAGAGGADGAGALGVAGQAEAARLLTSARGNAAAGFRSDRLSGIEDAADLRSSAANSGQNLGNTIRQRLASLLLNNKQSRGFSPEELDAIEGVVRGTRTGNALRYTGNLLGGGGGIGQTSISALGGMLGAAAGGMEGAGLGAAIPAVAGSSSRALYNSMVGRQLRNADELVRMRSPLYQQRLSDAPLTTSPADARAAALVRGLLLSGASSGQPSQ